LRTQPTTSTPQPIWHCIDSDQAIRILDSDPIHGLTAAAIAKQQALYGLNELKGSGGRSLATIFWEQIRSTMIVILLLAGGIAWFIKGDGGIPIDAIAIFSIVILFVVLGVFQEYRAQQAIAALKRMAAPNVRVVREGVIREISSRDLVPGDLIRLETGSVVPADCRLIETINLRIQEAALTGESEPVDKLSETLENETLPLGDRKNIGYAGTHVTFGRGTGLVVSTGMQTELGHIASMIENVTHTLTPLQKKLDHLGKTLGIIAVFIAILVGLTGFAEGKTVPEVLILAVSIAVAIVPEGLPAVLTFTLAIGAKRMLRRKALIRKLPAVETLGSVTVICSDKTGTLTMNQMTVTQVETLDGTWDPTHDQPPNATCHTLLKAAVLCNDASIPHGSETGIGDPTETALLFAGIKAEMEKSTLQESLPRIKEFAFDSDRKRMTTIHHSKGGLEQIISFTKGAADQMLEISAYALKDGAVIPLDDALRKQFQQANEAMARQGIRVLGVAYREFNYLGECETLLDVEKNLVFIGLAGMIDPPRPEAKEAVARCNTAGIRTIMITGDHPDTALTIARELGMATAKSKAITGVALEKMTDAELAAMVEQVSVFARVSPEHKLRIVGALQTKGHVVAMTGDGVNDAPALKKADIGIAMGITGTDVAKEAADMVLVDDNFATIVNAVEEGRVVFDNLRRFIMFSLAGNIAKVVIVAIPPLLGMIAMLKPIQILFSNLLTDGFLGIGMGMEAAERNTMTRPPISPKESILSRGIATHVAVVGPGIGLLFLLFGWWQWNELGISNLTDSAKSSALLTWGTLMFTALAFMQIGRVFSSRSFTEPAWTLSLRKNLPLAGMVLITILLQLIVVYIEPAGTFFLTTPLGSLHLLEAIGMAVIILLLMEIQKKLFFRTTAS